MKNGKTALAAVAIAVLAGCGQQPLKPGDSHIREQAAETGAIPPPVQITPVLPQPKATARPETYSVVVNNVRVQELLFALARDARQPPPVGLRTPRSWDNLHGSLRFAPAIVAQKA